MSTSHARYRLDNDTSRLRCYNYALQIDFVTAAIRLQWDKGNYHN